MQLCNLTLRLGGSLLHTVPKVNTTPAEILILRKIHGDDACVDIRPTRFDKSIRQEPEYDRLSQAYDRAGSLNAAPGDEHKSVMASMFPGAMKKLPTTLEEIGLGHLLSSASIAAADAGHGAAAIAEPFAPEGRGLNFAPVGGEPLSPGEEAEADEATDADRRNDEVNDAAREAA